MQEMFRRAAHSTATALGTPWAFIVATLSILVWAATGPAFGYNQTWQLIINTGTTLVTFLAVFLIQNTQNRDSKAVHLKLDGLIQALEQASNKLIDIENRPDKEVQQISDEFQELRASGTDVGEIEHEETTTEKVEQEPNGHHTVERTHHEEHRIEKD